MIPFAKNNLPMPTDDEMRSVYDQIKTPVKHGAVIKWDKDFTDSPSVFFKDGKFYMYFIAISKDVSVSGYETHIASSEDLLHWEYDYPVFRRNNLNHWDKKYFYNADGSEDNLGELLFKHAIFGADLLLGENFTVSLGYNYRISQELSVAGSKWDGFTAGANLAIKRVKLGASYSKLHVSSSSLLFNISYAL